MANVFAAALGLVLSGLLALLIAWHLRSVWSSGELPSRDASTVRRRTHPKSFALLVGVEFLGLAGLIAVAIISAVRLVTLLSG
jgi:hypothetical protein